VNLYIPFLAQGLVTFGKRSGYEGETTVVTSWKAQFWSAGGVTAVMLRDPADTATRDQVHAILTQLAADPANGIDQILEHTQIAEHGGFPDAAFLVVMKPGYVAGSATSGPLVVTPTAVHGTHGFWPLFPEMHSSFFILGKGVARGRNLGVIDMRQIAPTVAGILGVSLPAAKQPPRALACTGQSSVRFPADLLSGALPRSRILPGARCGWVALPFRAIAILSLQDNEFLEKIS
jgi:hypothetical protein